MSMDSDGKITTIRPWTAPTVMDLPYWSWRDWATKLTNTHIRNMTALLLKDVILKLAHAKKIQEFYEGSITYELGTLAAGMREKYMAMVKIYKENANLTKHRIFNPDIVTECIHKLAIVQGEYMEILQEFQMFNKIVAAYELKALEQKRIIADFKHKHQMKPGGGPQINLSTTKKSGRRYKDIWEQEWWGTQHGKVTSQGGSAVEKNGPDLNQEYAGRVAPEESKRSKVRVKWKPKEDSGDLRKIRNKWKSGFIGKNGEGESYEFK